MEAVATDPFKVMPGITIVPAMPTEDFLGKNQLQSILRSCAGIVLLNILMVLNIKMVKSGI